MKHQLTLYHYWRSSCSWRVRWSLAHKQILFQSVLVNILEGEQSTPEFKKHNPMGMVPCLAVDGHGISESMAILEWLEETYPEHRLLPTAPLDRAWVRQVCEGIVGGTQPLQNISVLKFYSADGSAQKKWAQHFIARGLAATERLLEERSGTFSLGDQMTLADLCLIPQVYNAHRFEVSLENLPNCGRIYDSCRTLETCRASSPESWKA